jgi:hypothetical protein
LRPDTAFPGGAVIRKPTFLALKLTPSLLAILVRLFTPHPKMQEISPNIHADFPFLITSTDNTSILLQISQTKRDRRALLKRTARQYRTVKVMTMKTIN